MKKKYEIIALFSFHRKKMHAPFQKPCIELLQSKSQHNRYDVITWQYVMFQHTILTKVWISQWTKNMEKDRQDTNIVPFVTGGRIEMQINADLTFG